MYSLLTLPDCREPTPRLVFFVTGLFPGCFCIFRRGAQPHRAALCL